MIQITKENFKTEIIDFKGVILVDFWAEWCPPCKALEPILEEVALYFKDNPSIKISKCDTETNDEITAKFNIMSIPNMKIFKNGELVGALVGLTPRQIIIDKLNYFLAGK